MKKITIKYNIAVAIIVMITATAISACASSKEDIIIDVDQYKDDYGDKTVKVINGPYNETIIDDNATNSSDSNIYVYICGAVANPNVYCIDASARIIDAINAAGGANANAGIEFLNLAQPLKDGQKIYVPTDEEVKSAIEAGTINSDTIVHITSNQIDFSQNDTESVSKDSNNKININTADASALMTIPGVGESKANKIIEYRQCNGGFSSIEDIMLISGIKEGMFNKIKDYICVD